MTRFVVVMFFVRKTPSVALPFLIKINRKNWSKRCRIPLVLLNCTIQEILLRLIRKPYYTRLALATRPTTKSKGTFLTQLFFFSMEHNDSQLFRKKYCKTHFAPEIHWLCVKANTPHRNTFFAAFHTFPHCRKSISYANCVEGPSY